MDAKEAKKISEDKVLNDQDNEVYLGYLKWIDGHIKLCAESGSFYFDATMKCNSKIYKAILAHYEALGYKVNDLLNSANNRRSDSHEIRLVW